MIEIEIAFEYFDEGLSNITKELQEAIELYKDNYLVYYIFYNNYCIFSNIEITRIEAETLVEFIESDKGIDKLYSEGIQTDYAKYVMFQKGRTEKDKDIKTKNVIFENKVENYVRNIEKINKINELEKTNEQYKNQIEELKANNNIILETRELLEEYQKLVKQKDEEINKLKENNLQINETMNRMPRIIRRIFLRNNKLLN